MAVQKVEVRGETYELRIPDPSGEPETFPDAEIMLMGVEEPQCLIHAPNESVDPSEIENLAIAEALFLRDYVRPE